MDDDELEFSGAPVLLADQLVSGLPACWASFCCGGCAVGRGGRCVPDEVGVAGVVSICRGGAALALLSEWRARVGDPSSSAMPVSTSRHVHS